MTKKKKKQKGYSVPEAVRAVLDVGRRERGQDWATDFELNPDSNELSPKNLPEKRGNTIAVLPGRIPIGEENNSIIEMDGEIRSTPIIQWISTYKFYIGQIVSFWKPGITYIFQIRQTDKYGVGEFVLIDKVNVEQQPGVATRTSETGAKRSGYAR